MGGRGASSGVSDNGNEYGSQYETILKSGNIKFVKQRPGATESLLETRTRGRIYVLIGKKGPKSIMYYDNAQKRSKRIDLDHSHQKKKPHVQHGYYGTSDKNGKAGANNLTPEEKKMVDWVEKLWDNYLKSKK